MKRLWRELKDMARLMVGQPSYEMYLRHMKTRHPDRKPMNEVEFFRNREQARYGGGGGRCC